jgi:3-methyl-2-oxobutanoate hydroxymethyltransferase
MKETGCAAVKVEGGRRIVNAVKLMTEFGIPVMGHLGLTPQSIHQFGTYRTRGVDDKEAENIFFDAIALQDAGAFSIVLEKIPTELAKKITKALTIPTIGIGAGPHCDGQVLVYTDMLGLTVDFNPRFVRRYAHLADEIKVALSRYANDIRSGDFPNMDESY